MSDYKSFINPPDEVYEIAWRNALDALKDAGPDAAHVIVIATPTAEDGTFATRFSMSSGRHKVTNGQLLALLDQWVKEEEPK
jgi:hypothetical protein